MTRRWWLAAAMAMLVSVCTGCGRSADPLSSNDFCQQLAVAIEDNEKVFDSTPDDVDIDFTQGVSETLDQLSNGVPTDAPAQVGRLLELGAVINSATAEAAQADDNSVFFSVADEAIEELESTNWDPAEDWTDSTCGIDVLAIQLRLRSDDRTASS